MALTGDLPSWNPGPPPEAHPPARTQAWVSRIGIPGAIFLGRVRPRLIGAVISFLFVPVGAVRAFIGSQQPSTATDDWGPADAFVLVAAVAGVVAFVLFIRSARGARSSAAHSASVILRPGNPAVTQDQIAAVLQSTDRFDEWAQSIHLTPYTETPAAVETSSEGARLMFARSTRWTMNLLVPRFGEPLARAFRATRIEAWIGVVLVLGGVVVEGALVIVSFILGREGYAEASNNLLQFQYGTLAAFVIGWAVVLFARYGPRGRYAIVDAVRPALASRDPRLTRDSIGAMFARPYMYDLWVQKYHAS